MSQGLAIPPELDAQMTPEVRAFVRLLLGRISQLEEEVAELKQQLKVSSRFHREPAKNSPPPAGQNSSPPKTPVKKRRKRGGQPGHPKHARPLIPSDQCDEVKALKPTMCRGCGTALEGEDPEPLRHQVYELPEIKLGATQRG